MSLQSVGSVSIATVMREVIEWAYCHVNQLNRERNHLRI